MTIARDDTIVALATARGVAALAIVRLSGPMAVTIADSCFPSVNVTGMASHSVSVGVFADEAGHAVDEVVITVFLAPRTVTGEDIVEISCHGGDFAARTVIQTLISAGARAAGPGEFTMRGFLNGKMDLSQAEAVADLIHASSNRAQQQSMVQLKGDYSSQIEELRAEMLDLCAFIELELDFAEEDVEFADPERITNMLTKSLDLLGRLTQSYRFGSIVRDGIRIVIGGKPNAGKSTLLNALVGFDRAIVSDIPGTTRDEIEADVEYDGLRLIFRDTAGLRETDDLIEAEGVRRAETAIREADIVLYVFDAAIGLADEEVGHLSRDIPVMLVANKVDLLDKDVATSLPSSVADRNSLLLFPLSALSAQYDSAVVSDLLLEIVRAVRGAVEFDESTPVVTNERHQGHLLRALEAVKKADQAWRGAASGDILSLELRVAMDELGAIIGETTSDDVLGHIFSRFCIGK
jgi:tRNA modification GTPase